jgi:hypothetical protein
MSDLTSQERQFTIWALGYIEGVALEMHDDNTAQEADRIAEKLKNQQPTPASPSPRALDQAPAAAREAASLASEPNRPVKPPGTGERGSSMT